MIGSHDSFTYLKSTNSVYNSFSATWRTQTKTIAEQYSVGVRYFDLRVTLERRGNRNMWQAVHGAARLDKIFISLKAVCELINSYGDAYFRLLLENNKYEKEFKESLAGLPEQYPSLVYVAMKNPWTEIYSDSNFQVPIEDFSYIPWNTGQSFMWNLKHFKPNTIKNYAKKHNPKITKEMIEDKERIYFMDFV